MHQLRIKTYAEYLRLPASDRSRWRYFFAKEPDGYHAKNWRMGVAVAGLINTMLGLKNSDALHPSDIYPLEHTENITFHKPADPKAVLGLLNLLRK